MSNKKNPTKVLEPQKAEGEVKLTALHSQALQNLVAKTVNTGLSPQSFVKYLDFVESITAASNKYLRDGTTLMKSYGIATLRYNTATGEKSFDYQQHPKKVEIGEKLKALQEVEVKCKALNFMTAEELHQFTQGLSMLDIQILSFWLKVKTK